MTPELLRLTAAVCDTKRIAKNIDKMFVLSNLLYTYDVDFEFLGGATNRLVLLCDGYAVKFAVDDQGFRDNLIEYSLSAELQPYVTKSYETNGYVLIAEFVEIIKEVSVFQAHKTEIIKILDILGKDHLLGDVGFLVKNMTNWGLRDGHPVIVDYAYCHRFTENLFTCNRCGRPLIYDQTYDKLMCTDRSMCKAIYTYNERKRIQGKQIDEDMIVQRKAESIVMGPGETEREIQRLDDILVGGNKFVIDSSYDEAMYQKLREEKLMEVVMNGNQNRMDMLIQLARNPHDAQLRKEFFDVPDSGIPEAIYTEDYENEMAEDPNYLYYNGDAEEDDDEYPDADEDGVPNMKSPSLDDLIARAKQAMAPNVPKRTIHIKFDVPDCIKRIIEQSQRMNEAAEENEEESAEPAVDETEHVEESEETLDVEDEVVAGEDMEIYDRLVSAPIGVMIDGLDNLPFTDDEESTDEESIGMDPAQVPPVVPVTSTKPVIDPAVDTSGPNILVNGQPIYKGQRMEVV